MPRGSRSRALLLALSVSLLAVAAAPPVSGAQTDGEAAVVVQDDGADTGGDAPDAGGDTPSDGGAAADTPSDGAGGETPATGDGTDSSSPDDTPADDGNQDGDSEADGSTGGEPDGTADADGAGSDAGADGENGDDSTDGTSSLPPCPSPGDGDADGTPITPTTGAGLRRVDAPADGETGTSPTSDVTTGDGEAGDDAEPCTSLPDDLPQPDGDDELSGEGPSERPDGEEGDGWVQQPFAPTVVIQELVDAAQAKVDEAEAARVDAIARVRVLRRRLKELTAARDELDSAERDAAVELSDVTERLQIRATMAFVIGDNSRLGVATSNEEALRADAQQHVVQHVVQDDIELIETYRALRDDLSDEALEVVARLGVVEDLLDSAIADVEAAELAIQDLELEVLAFSNGAQSFISGIRFPIGGNYEVPLIDSWGFPRMLGTPDEHWHEGIDIFAPLGSELVATESGTITNVGVGRLGGLKFWLTGDSGTKWYYAHLSDFAPGLAVGQRVEAGDVLGYVGNTGNAVGTPYHLHLQMHPDGGDAANPYPILKAASDWERAARVSAGLPEIPLS